MEKMLNEKMQEYRKNRNREECSIKSPYKIPIEKNKEKIRKAHLLITDMHIHMHKCI